MEKRIIVALDVDSFEKAAPLVEALAPHAACFKAGLELLTSEGTPRVIEFVHGARGQIFVDVKLNDIPNTVGRAVRTITNRRVKMFNVMASAGIPAMMAAAANKQDSLFLAVSVLTSLEENNAYLIFGAPIKAKVLQFARDAKLAGADGIICSPQELLLLRKQPELSGLLYVTPGVRPVWATKGDQERVMTPGEAIGAGADYLVIGRPITNPPPEIGTPLDAMERINAEIAEALAEKGDAQ